MKKCALIMAGGSGTRLWPVSRKDRPKQFVSLGDGPAMLQLTLERVLKVIPPADCYITAGREQEALVAEASCSLIPSENIILEPVRRDTSTCIAAAALKIRRKLGNAILCCIPSDSHIIGDEAYKVSLEAAIANAAVLDRLVLLGVTPRFPSSGYGYIKPSEKPDMQDGFISKNSIFEVKSFMEKPDEATAASLIKEGCLWNTGTLVAQVHSILSSMEKFLPEQYRLLSEAIPPPGEGKADEEKLMEAYEMTGNISFDSGVLQNSGNLSVVRGSFHWSDIGTLDALSEIIEKDSAGNSIYGSFAGWDNTNTVVYSKDGLVAALGLDGLVVVKTGDIVLVCPRERSQEVRQLVAQLRLDGLEKYL